MEMQFVSFMFIQWFTDVEQWRKYENPDSIKKKKRIRVKVSEKDSSGSGLFVYQQKPVFLLPALSAKAAAST